jgi:hypothetical protein
MRPRLPRSAEITGPKKARQQFAVVPAYVILDRTITPAQKTVMQVICLHANQDGWAWPKLDTIGEILGVQKPQVSKMIEALREAGCIEVQYRVHNRARKMFFRVIYDRPLETLDVATTEAGEEPEEVSKEETTGQSSGFPVGNESFPSRKQPVSMVETPLFEHSSEQTREQELPTPPRADVRAPADEVVGLSAQFTHEVHREAYLAIRESHRFARGFDAALNDIHAPINGGETFAWDVIGAALLQVRGNSETFNGARFRGYCRRHLANPLAAPQAAAAGQRVTLSGTPLTPQRFWDLCVETGLTARGQSASALDHRIERFASLGAIAEVEPIKALVLHVEPWTLALVTFTPDRLTKLRERFASYVLSHPEAA